MNCPQCGKKLKTSHTYDYKRSVLRIRYCPDKKGCGFKQKTSEELELIPEFRPDEIPDLDNKNDISIK